MQLENVFLKYIPIFNSLGESRVLLSDFHIINPLRPKNHRVIKFFVFTSLLLTIILSIMNAAIYIHLYPEDSGTPQIVFFIMFAFRTNSKFSSLLHMRSWLDHLPKLYNHFKELERITESRYQMDFREFQAQFDHEVTIVFIIWLMKILIYFALLSQPFLWDIVCVNESIVLFLNHIIFFHIYFYVLLFKWIMAFYIGYVERKAVFDQPGTRSDLKVELVFIKIINLKLCETSKVLNDSFGWIIVWILIQKFVEVVGNVFWIHGNLNCQSIFDVIRNYDYFYNISFKIK